MAIYDTNIKRYNGVDWDILRPKTIATNVSISDINNKITADNLEDALQEIVDNSSTIRSCRLTIGTSVLGWTNSDCDYLCDGTADDVEINKALNDLPATGGEIILLDGVYDIKSKITINKNNTVIKGNGNSTVLKRGYDTLSTDIDGLICISSNNCELSNTKIDSNVDIYSDPYNKCLTVDGDFNRISNNYFVNSLVTMITIKNATSATGNNTTIANNVFENIINGLAIQTGSSNNLIYNNKCKNCSKGGISTKEGGDYNHILNNSVMNSTNNGNGINILSKYNVVSNNICTENNRYGINVASGLGDFSTFSNNICNNNLLGIYVGSSNCTVTGNVCCFNNEGIFSSYSKNTIVGNTCNNNTEYGIDCDGGSHMTISGNICNNNEKGIYLVASSNFCELTGNSVCDNSMLGIYIGGSSYCNVSGNTCMVGTGGNYTGVHGTLDLSNAKYCLVSSNLIFGKNYTDSSGTSNTFVNNKYN